MTDEANGKPMRKIAIGLVFLILVAIVGGWSALWYYASQEASRQVDAWLKTEASQGRVWTCPNRDIGGYPFAINVSCVKPSFAGTARDQTVQGTLAALVAGTSIVNPRHVNLELTPPLAYRSSDGKADVNATWSRFTIGADDHSLTIHATDLGVDGNFGDTGRQSGNASLLDASFEMVQPVSNEMLGFTIGVRGAGMPPLDALLGGQQPVDVDLAGQLDHAAPDNARTPEEAIERWREAGGHVELSNARISRAESSVSGTGTLQLDETHRVQGRIDASFVGLEPVLKRYGISGNIAAAGSLLNSLFGEGSKQPQPEQARSADPNALNLPISFKGGRLGVGPIRTPIVLPPLY